MSEILGNMTDLEKLKILLGREQQGGVRRDINDQEMAANLRQRVRGQDHVMNEVCSLIRREWATKSRTKPIASMFFVGPPGTGKTELAKAMGSYLFGDEKNILRFDCSEFSGMEGKTRLIGTPVGYVGSDTGGQLTRPMLNNPRRLVLFDEIEKAFSGIFDLFLSMMDDGRLTEQGSGRIADFTQSIIVLTSNAETDAIAKIDSQIEDPHEKTNAIKQHLRDCKVFRQELLSRIDLICVFKKLDGMVTAEIAVLKMKTLAIQYGLELKYVGPELIVEAMNKGNKLKDFGVREIDRAIGSMLGDAMIAARDAGLTKIKLSVDNDGALQVEPAE